MRTENTVNSPSRKLNSSNQYTYDPYGIVGGVAQVAGGLFLIGSGAGGLPCLWVLYLWDQVLVCLAGHYTRGAYIRGHHEAV